MTINYGLNYSCLKQSKNKLKLVNYFPHAFSQLNLALK